MLSPKSYSNQVIERNGRMGKDACAIMAAAINAVDPYESVRTHFSVNKDHIRIGNENLDCTKLNKIILIGFGKAAVPMAKAVIDLLGDQLTLAVVVTKDAGFKKDDGYKGKLQVLIGGHPVPTEASIKSTRAVLANLPELTAKDLVLVVISGGGSALFTSPMPGISLADLQKVTDLLLRSGADIQEINTLRKHLDQVKGGRLAERLAPARVETLILSDVIGDRLDMIASGPTVADPTTYDDAWQVVRKYHLEDKLPASVRTILEKGRAKQISETLKEEAFRKMNVHNHLVGTNTKAALAAQQKAKELDYQAIVISTHLTGLTKDVSNFISGIIQTEMQDELPAAKPVCLIFGGETTVILTGDGRGGRNQDLVLRMVPRLAGYRKVLFISLATDGEDGPTDAAGAASDAMVFRDGAVVKGLNVDTCITTNNSYEYFERVGGSIKTGSTGTNVNDLILFLADI
jgi:glycerate 2-kinase